MSSEALLAPGSLPPFAAPLALGELETAWRPFDGPASAIRLGSDWVAGDEKFGVIDPVAVPITDSPAFVSDPAPVARKFVT